MNRGRAFDSDPSRAAAKEKAGKAQESAKAIRRQAKYSKEQRSK
jgi:hypothetical protein